MDVEESVQLTLCKEFVSELLKGYFRGAMNARKVCVHCHWASLSGVSEAIFSCFIATASSSSPDTCCLRARGTWRLQFANRRCAIAGAVVGAPSFQLTDSSCGAFMSLASAKNPDVETRWVSMDPQGRQTQSSERHRHGVQGRRHGYPRNLGSGVGFWRGLPSTIHASRAT